ncbi:hypothetical protein EON65_07965 [archaeon]|nr:MAG: hypothetical protein EON65_07965 [archaeon]
MRRIESKFADRVLACRQDLDDFSKALKTIEELEQKVRDSNWETVQKSLNKTLADIQQKEQEIKVITPKIQTVQQEIAFQEHTKRNIAANLDLRMGLIELQSLREGLKLKEAQSGGNAEQIKHIEKATELREKQQALVSEREREKGKLEVHRLRGQEIESLLSKAPYRHVEEKYRRKNIEFETTNLAVGDLDNYYIAL